MKEAIKEAYQRGIRQPRNILKYLDEEGYESVTRTQVSNFLARFKKDDFSGAISFGELEQMAVAMMSVPDDEDEAFVIGFEGHYEESDEDNFFRLALMKSTLLKQ